MQDHCNTVSLKQLVLLPNAAKNQTHDHDYVWVVSNVQLMTTNKSPTGQMLHSPGSDEVCQSVHLHVDGQELQVE